LIPEPGRAAVPNFRLTLEYDGTDFAGWQLQAGSVRTLQGELENAIARVAGAPARVFGAGRTDAGVHAEGQVASVRLATVLDARSLGRALNAVLPPDLAVVACDVVADDFHARHHARSKLYRYRIWNGARPSPLRARTSWRVKPALTAEAMQAGAQRLLGEHDFASFQAVGSDVASTRRTLTRCDVERGAADDASEARGEITIHVEGSGFLRHMVRILVGTLVQVGSAHRSPESLTAVLAAADRRAAGPTAPPQGLTLVRVDY